MTKVYMVEGYFGADEWTERCFSNKEAAEEYCNYLWIKRESERYPTRLQGYALGKFFVEEYELYD